MSRSRLRRAGRLAPIALLPVTLALGPIPAAAGPSSTPNQSTQDGVALVRVVVPDQAGIQRLHELDVDLAEYRKPVDGGFEVHAVLSPQQAQALREQGFDVRGTITDEADQAENQAQRQAAIAAATAAESQVDTLTVLRAEWFTSLDDQRFLSVEVKSSATDAETVLTAAWDSGPGTAPDSGGTATMSRFTDAGQYMYHRFNTPLPVAVSPTTVTVTSNRGGTVTAPVTEWLGAKRTAPSRHYVSDFVDHYLDPTEVNARITALSREFPKISELIDLPYRTNGYRRTAQAQLGSGGTDTLYVTSRAYGSAGGNDLSVALVQPDSAAAPLHVTVNGDDVVVHLATDDSGAISSTARQVVDAINASPAASTLMTASTYRGNDGSGLVAAAPPTLLSDNLKAPAHISRQPFAMKALRIGAKRDGSRVGVFLYCQEHAREWVTSLTCVETAERLLRNYTTDAPTRRLVDGLDIFVLPMVNPDGAHYSMYDYNWQRKNMTDRCAADASDPGRRNSWGVDINRNFTVGSVFDGYSGASTTCTSAVFAGPAELSEPESRNEVWLTTHYPNIKFAMNTHSYGGYFMWPPGSYQEAGRQTLPRVDFGTENYFWDSSRHILSAVQQHRGTAIWPGRTGPVPDVLYSAAGNSADEHWYNRGIIGWDFEVGADIYDPATGRFQPVGFQPPFAEGHEEAMEFAAGQIGILEVAYAYSVDRQLPASDLLVTATGTGRTTFTFSTDEPANVYYTLDGSPPTLDSTKLTFAGTREGPAQLTVDRDTVVNWFAVDIAGNVEHNYRPDGSGGNYNTRTVTVSGG